MKDKSRSYFISTSYQKILSFLSKNSTSSFFDKEIAKKTGLSAGATNTALRKLAKDGLILKEKKGRMNFYNVDIYNPIIRQFKVLENAILLSTLINKLKGDTEKIILFGSVRDGTDTAQSDVDLLILTNTPNKARGVIAKFKLPRKIQAVVRTPLQFVEMETKEATFYHEVVRGIVLWEKRE